MKGWIHAFRLEGPFTVLSVYFPLPASPWSFRSLMLTPYHVAPIRMAFPEPRAASS